MVAFMCPLGWAKRYNQGAGKTFLGVSGRLFTEEVTVVSRRIEAHGPLQCGWASPNPLRIRRWRKEGVRVTLSA